MTSQSVRDVEGLRAAANLSQETAAKLAKVSVATWRRYERDPASVKPQTAQACSAVLAAAAPRTFRRGEEEFRRQLASFKRAWSDSAVMTPRQAYTVAAVLNLWIDLSVREWLEADANREPLHTVAPFDQFDLRVMMLVNENRAWADGAMQHLSRMADDVSRGLTPFAGNPCLFDEVAFIQAACEAESTWSGRMFDDSSLDDVLPPKLRQDPEQDDDGALYDDEWGLVDYCMDQASDLAEVFAVSNSPLTQLVLPERHPFTWFDQPLLAP